MSGTASNSKTLESESNLTDDNKDTSKDIEYAEHGERQYDIPSGYACDGGSFDTAAGNAPLKLDKYGVPLTPQPSDDPEDPCTLPFSNISSLNPPCS